MRLIDADALREVHCASCSEAIRSGCKDDPVCASLLWVDEAPTIDAVPVVHGRWDDNYNCTVCGEKALFEEKPDPHHPCHLLALFYLDSDYCPNCGAKMDGDQI